MSIPSAAAFTGGGARCCPRPRGRSGRVTIAASSWSLWAIRIRDGTENSGVPINTSLKYAPQKAGLGSPPSHFNGQAKHRPPIDLQGWDYPALPFVIFVPFVVCPLGG